MSALHPQNYFLELFIPRNQLSHVAKLLHTYVKVTETASSYLERIAQNSFVGQQSHSRVFCQKMLLSIAEKATAELLELPEASAETHAPPAYSLVFPKMFHLSTLCKETL